MSNNQLNIKFLDTSKDITKSWTFRLKHLRYKPGISYLYDLYYLVRNYFKPRQAWYVKGMYHHFCDKPELITQSLYNAIIDYVEGEKCFESISWDHNDEVIECAAFIRECYNWIKVERPKLEAKIEDIINHRFTGVDLADKEAWQKLMKSDKTYDELYPGLTELENELLEKDTEYLCKIVKYRNFLWT